jgi:myo-inositol-1(or 4)-monophosphatase
MKLNPWDMAAGVLIVNEAGGLITDFQGGKFNIYGDELVASNGFLHDRMLEVLKEDT